MLTKPKIQPCSVFQSTLPCGSELQSCNRPCNSHGVSIHTPSRELLARKHKTRLSDAFQSTLPRESDNWTYMQSNAHQLISIHAPLRERHLYLDTFFFFVPISIHAPLRERLTILCNRLMNYNFNPRSLAGATNTTSRCLRISLISIHAPLRERRLAVLSNADVFRISIHAPLRERLRHATVMVTAHLFQSTLPYGSD